MGGSWVSSLVAAWLLAASSAGGAARSDDARPWAGTLSPLVKVRPGQPLPSSARDGVLSAARGECESLQLLVSPGQEDVTLEPVTLKGPDGGAAVPVEVFREAFIPVRTPSNSEGAPGLHPDPLLPVRFAPRATLGASTSERPLVLWLDACVPATATPGRYTGVLSLRAKNAAPTRLPLALDVLPFTLPATSSLPNTFGISLYSVSKGHGLEPSSPQARELLHAYARAALGHRVSLHGMFIDAPPVKHGRGGVEVDFRGYDEEMARYFDGTALPNGARFTAEKIRDTADCKTDDQQVEYLRAWRKHFAERGWKTELFFYAKDEPKPKDYPLVRRQASMVRRAGGLPVLVTAPLEPALRDSADILTPVLNCFFARSGPATCPRVNAVAPLRQALGPQRRVWWYQSCMSHGCDGGPIADRRVEEAFRGWASYMVDHPAPLNRAMGPLAFLSGVDGELYFDTVAAYNAHDPWQDVFLFGGNGDGTLFYPGTPQALSRQAAEAGGTHQPVVSMRLKHIRDGLEDYEYLRLLAAKGQAGFAKDQAKRLTRTGYQVERDIEVWRQVRASMSSKLAGLAGGQEYGGSGRVGQ